MATNLATNLYVNIDWAGSKDGDLIRDGSKMLTFGTDAFADIQSAVDAADPAGSVIEVREGTYAGNVTLTKNAVGEYKNNLTIKAAEGADVNVTGTFNLGAADDGWQGGLTIEGIDFDSTNNHSLQMTYAYNVTVKDCSFNGAVGNYMLNIKSYASGSGNILFEDCEFGIGYVQIYRANIRDGRGVEFTDCDFDESTVNVQGGYDVKFNDCDFSKTLTDYYAEHSFYILRSNDVPITLNGGTINVDSTASTVPDEPGDWAILWQRQSSTDEKPTKVWNVDGVKVNYTQAAADVDDLFFNKNGTTKAADAPSRVTFENLTTDTSSAATVDQLLAKTSGYAIAVTDNTATLYSNGASVASTAATELFVNSAWAGSKVGTEVVEGKYYGFNAYAAIDDARQSVKPGVETTINLSGNLDGIANFNWGQNVVLTGTAAINWKAGWLFVGRGGTGTDRDAVTTVTVKDANISSINPSTGFSSTGFHVSGYNTDSGNTNYGKLVIEDSTITCDYLINRNVVDIIGSDATFVNMYIHGRSASESKSGTDETATLTIKDSTTKKDDKGKFISSTVTLTHINGMDLGVESYGVINVQDASSFNITADGDWTITTKGTVNLTDTAHFTATKGVVNNGAINMTAGNTFTAKSISGDGSITIDATGLAENSTVKVIDITGAAGFDASKVEVTGARKIQGKDGDVFVTNETADTYYVNAAWVDEEIGATVTTAQGGTAKYGISAFSTFDDAYAVASAQTGTETIFVESDTDGNFSDLANVNVLNGTSSDSHAKVSIGNTYPSWLYIGNATIGEDVTINTAYWFANEDFTLDGTLKYTGQGYHGYDNVVTISETGYLGEGSEALVIRFNKDSSAGIYVTGNAEQGAAEADRTLQLNVNYFSFYSGTISLTDTLAQSGPMFMNAALDIASYADYKDFLILDNAIYKIKGVMTMTGDATLNMSNQSTLTTTETFTVNAGSKVNVDATSTITTTSTFTNSGDINISVGGTITAKSFTNSGNITIDLTGFKDDDKAIDVIIVTSATGTAIDKDTVTLIGTGVDVDDFGVLAKANGGVSVAKLGPNVYVNEAWKDLADGTPIAITTEVTATKGINAFAYFDDAIATAGKTIYLYGTNTSANLITGKLEDSVLEAGGGAAGIITFTRTDTKINTLVGDLTIGNNVTFGATNFVHNAANEDAEITVNGTFDVLATTATLFEGTMTVNGKVVSTGDGGALVIRDGYSLVVNKDAEINVNTRIFDATATFTNASMTADLTIANNKGAVDVSTATITGKVTNAGLITVNDLGTFSAASIENTGTIDLVIDVDDIDVATVTYKLINITGTGAAPSTSGITVNGEAWSTETTSFTKTVGGVDYTYRLMQFENDICLSSIDVDPAQVYVNGAWTSDKYEYGQMIEKGKYYLINAFGNMSDASKAVPVGTPSTITVSGTDEIAAASAFGGGQDVTITGTASFFWGAGWMFVGRNAAQGDVTQLAKVTFKDATIDRIAHTPNPGDCSINISGAEKDSTSKGYDEVDFDNSKVTTEYIIDKNQLNVYNGSELTVTGYLNVAGRPASETPTGEDYTAKLNIDHATVNGQSNLEIGNEGKGEINLTNGAVLKADKIIAEKSVINATGSTIESTGALTNSGSISLAGESTMTTGAITNSTNGSISADNSTIAATSIFTYGSFTATNNSEIKSTSTHITNLTTFNVTDSTVSASGSFLNGRDSNKPAAKATFTNATLTGSVTNYENATLSLTDSSITRTWGTITNNGTFKDLGGSTITIKDIENTGTFSIAGTAESKASTLKVLGTLTGTIELLDGANITATINAGGTFNVGKHVETIEEVETEVGNDVTFSGENVFADTEVVNAGNILIKDDSSISAKSIANNGTITAIGTSTIDADIVNTKTVNFGTEDAALVTTYAKTLTGRADINGEGTNVTLTGTMQGSAAPKTNAGSLWVTKGATLTVEDGGVVKNYATLIFRGDGVFEAGSQLLNFTTAYLPNTTGAMEFNGTTEKHVTVNSRENGNVVGTVYAYGNMTADYTDFNLGNFSVAGIEDKKVVVTINNSTMNLYAGLSVGQGDENTTATLNLNNSTATVGAVRVGKVIPTDWGIGTGYEMNLTNTTITAQTTGQGSQGTVIIDAGNTLTMDTNSQIKFFKSWTNEGTLTVNVEGKTGAYCLVDNTGSSIMELADYGNVTLVGSGSDDFDLQVIDNDLWAINTGSSKVLYVNNTWTTHIVGGVEVPYEYGDPIDGREGLFFELNAFNNAASAIAAMGPLTTNLKFENNDGTSVYTLAGYTNLTQSLTIDSDAVKTALVGAEVRFGVDTDTPPNTAAASEEPAGTYDPRTFTINGNVEFYDMGTGKYGDTTLNINGNVTVRDSAWFRANTHTIIAKGASFKRAQSGEDGQLCVYGTVDVLGTLDYYTEGSMDTTLRIGSPSYTLPGILNVTGSAASLNIHADAKGMNYYAPKIESNGFLNVKEGATATFSGEVKNEGTITVSGESTLTASKITNTGSFIATGTADAKATVTAAIDNDVNATVEMTDVVFNKNTDSVNKGEWTVKDSSLTSYSVTNYDANSTFSAEDSTITMSRITNNGSFDVDGGAINTKKLQNAGTFTVKESDFTVSGQDGEALTNSGSFSFTAAEGKKFSAAKIVNSEDGLVTLTGDFTAEGALTIGELEGALTFKNVALKNFTLDSGTVIVDGTANDFTGSNSFADLEVASDASLTATARRGRRDGIFADTITNAGTITADSGIIYAETAITNGVAATETTESVKGTIIATDLTAGSIVNNNGAGTNSGSSIELTGDLIADDITNGVEAIAEAAENAEPANKAFITAANITADSITNFGTVGSQNPTKTSIEEITLTGALNNGKYGNVFASTLNAASIENEGEIVVENINITSTDGVIDNKAGGKIAQDNESMTIDAKAINNDGYISTHGGAITATAITNGAYDDETDDGLIWAGSIEASGTITNKGMIVAPTITADAIENNGGSIIVTNGTISSTNDIKNTGNGTLSFSNATVNAPWIDNKDSDASVTAEKGSVINASINNLGLVMISDSTLSVARVYATQTTAAQFVVTGDSALTITDAFKGTISLIDANLTDASVKFTGGDYADGTVVVDAILGTEETTFNGVSSFGNLSVAEGAMLSIVDTNVEDGAIVGPCLTVNGDFSIAGLVSLDVTAFDSILAEGKTAQVISVLGNITNAGSFEVTAGYQVIVQNDGIYVLRSSEPVEVDTICVNQAWKDHMQPGETFEFAGVDCVYGLNAFQNTNEILNLTDYTDTLIFAGGTADAYKPLVLSTGGEIELQVVKSTGSGVTGVAFEETTISNETAITGIIATSIDFGKLTVEDGSVLFFGEDAAEIIQTVTAGETTITDSFVDFEGDITINGAVAISGSRVNNDEDLKTSSTTIKGNVKITDSDVDFDGEATITGDVEITDSEVEFDRNTEITGLLTLDADSTIEADQGFSFEINNTSSNKAKINGEVLATNKDDENPSGSTNVDLGFITGTGKIYTDINADLSFEGDYTGTLFIDVTGLEGDAGKEFATVSSDTFTIKVTGTNVADDPDGRKLFKKYFTYSRNYGLKQNDGACNVIEAEGKTAAAILTAVNHNWEGADGKTYYSDNVLVNGCSSGTVYLQGNSSEQYITLSGSYTVGVYGGKECLETTARGGEDLGGDINIIVEGEDTVFTKVLVAGDRVNVASGRAEYYRESDINLTINGGTFKNYVAAGMMYQGVNVSGYAEIANTNLTISAGTFELNKDGLGGVFGGNYSNKKAGSVKTTVTGLSSVKIIAGEGDIVMAPALYAGSYGAGAVGATIVTFEGEQKEGQKLQFKQIWGGSSSDKIIRDEKTGNGTYEGSVSGARTLSFTGFTGTIECSSIAGFSHVIVNDSVATLTANDMSAVENWEFDVDSKLIGTGAFTNDFKGDTFKFGTDDDIENLAADFSWNVFEGIGDLNGTFGGFEKVTLFGETAIWDNVSSYASTNYTLSLQTIDEGESATTNMVVAAKLA